MRHHGGLKSSGHEDELGIRVKLLQHDKSRRHVTRELDERVPVILNGWGKRWSDYPNAGKAACSTCLLFLLKLDAHQSFQQLSVLLHRDGLPHVQAVKVHERVRLGERLHSRHPRDHLAEQRRSRGRHGESTESYANAKSTYPHRSDMFRKVIRRTAFQLDLS